ncbi:uncharacterized protein LOC132205056 [Neocloeon triangulifer]|uniref:uncharacterized protein LOC132205056 n=1 Tax=Neocloeon triangulifer TaxID=2078957 RepID=UPI00286FA7AD|nr:uncharacterized protein LOC132205056 [Neocloeon triangulifer]
MVAFDEAEHLRATEMTRFITLCISALLALQVVRAHEGHDGVATKCCCLSQCFLMTTLENLIPHIDSFPETAPVILPVITNAKVNAPAVETPKQVSPVAPQSATIAEVTSQQHQELLEKVPIEVLQQALADKLAAVKAKVPENLGGGQAAAVKTNIHEIVRQQEQILSKLVPVVSQTKASLPQVNLPKVSAAIPNVDAITSKVNSAIPAEVPNVQAAGPVQQSKINIHEVFRQLGLFSNTPLNTPVSIPKVQAAVPNVGAVASKVTSALPVGVPIVQTAAPVVSTVTGALPLNTGVLPNLPIAGSLGLRCNSCNKK